MEKEKSSGLCPWALRVIVAVNTILLIIFIVWVVLYTAKTLFYVSTPFVDTVYRLVTPIILSILALATITAVFTASNENWWWRLLCFVNVMLAPYFMSQYFPQFGIQDYWLPLGISILYAFLYVSTYKARAVIKNEEESFKCFQSWIEIVSTVLALGVFVCALVVIGRTGEPFEQASTVYDLMLSGGAYLLIVSLIAKAVDVIMPKLLEIPCIRTKLPNRSV